MPCASCGTRKARRACPALGGSICAACCGSKRQLEIACPTDCVWLRSAETHPPAARLRQYADDQRRLYPLLEGLEQGPYLALTVCLQEAAASRATAMPAPRDEDLEAAVAALIATLETAAKGVIYDHQPESLVAARLVGVMRQGLDRLRDSGMHPTDRDAALALRRLARAMQQMRQDHPDQPTAFFFFLDRVLRQSHDEARAGAELAERALADLAATRGDAEAASSRLILP